MARLLICCLIIIKGFGEELVKVDILIAEDETGILESLEFILKRAGWSVAFVTDGEAALKFVKVSKPKMMVLDIMLPKLSGFEVLKKLRANSETRNLPVLILTAKGQKRDRQQAEEFGASAFISKPYANDDVVDTVRQLLNLADFNNSQNLNKIEDL